MKHFFSFVYTLVVIIGLVACSSDNSGNTINSSFDTNDRDSSSKNGSLKDSRDGQSYKTIVIGSQIWMAENLNYETSGSYCYNNDPANCKKYGRLYTGSSAQKVCPSGWHLPSKLEFYVLFSKLDIHHGQFIISGTSGGRKLRSTSGWNDCGSGTDEAGFSALPAGYGGGFNNSWEYYKQGQATHFWSSTPLEENCFYMMELGGDCDTSSSDLYFETCDFEAPLLSSIRCIKDSQENSSKDCEYNGKKIPNGEMIDRTVSNCLRIESCMNGQWEIEYEDCYEDSPILDTSSSPTSYSSTSMPPLPYSTPTYIHSSSSYRSIFVEVSSSSSNPIIIDNPSSNSNIYRNNF